MSYIYTGETGTPLREIIHQLGDKNYPHIYCRCEWSDADGYHDEAFGECEYKDGELIPCDYDSYFLDDLYSRWVEWDHDDETYLIVWESGRASEEWE